MSVTSKAEAWYRLQLLHVAHCPDFFATPLPATVSIKDGRASSRMHIALIIVIAQSFQESLIRDHPLNRDSKPLYSIKGFGSSGHTGIPFKS